MKRTTIKGLVAVLLLIAIPLVVKQCQKPDAVEPPSFALLAAAPHCGPDGISAVEVAQTIKKFGVTGAANSDEVSSTLARVIKAFPPHVKELFEKRGIKIDTLRMYDNLGLNAFGRPFGVFKDEGAAGLHLLVAPDVDESSKVLSGATPEEVGNSVLGVKHFVRGLEEGLLPASLWLTFETLWETQFIQGISKETEPLAANIFAQMTQKLAGLMTFANAEQDFYFQEFPGAGTLDPAFAVRNLVLVATNVYCNQESYDRLASQQAEALAYFQSEFFCTLGKPYYWDQKKYLGVCPTQ